MTLLLTIDNCEGSTRQFYSDRCGQTIAATESTLIIVGIVDSQLDPAFGPGPTSGADKQHHIDPLAAIITRAIAKNRPFCGRETAT